MKIIRAIKSVGQQNNTNNRELQKEVVLKILLKYIIITYKYTMPT